MKAGVIKYRFRDRRGGFVMKYKKAIIFLILSLVMGCIVTFMVTDKKRLIIKVIARSLEVSNLWSIKTVERPEQVKRLNVIVTAYSNDTESINVPEWQDGLTATGTIARKGTIAGDWNVFKPGTRLYIPGYGGGTIEDRGGKVKGRHIDLFFDSKEKAVEWGIRHMEVLIVKNDG